MIPDWDDVDRRLMGDAWIGSQIANHVEHLCTTIGVRWAGSEAEHRAADFVIAYVDALGLQSPRVEEFPLRTWECRSARLVVDDALDDPLAARPCLFCPAIDVTARLVNAGFGMPHELAAIPGDQLQNAVALIDSGFEPFSEPRAFGLRLEELAEAGVRAAVTFAPLAGRRTSDISVADWRAGDPTSVPLPVLQTSREDFATLRRRAAVGSQVRVHVDAGILNGQSWNAVAEIPGNRWRTESLILSAHHDTTTDSPGANDNAAGVAVLIETARLLARLQEETGVAPGRTIRFVSFGAEEQGLQGSSAFVLRHNGTEPKPRLMINLDELSTGNMKGVVLQFPELRPLVQSQLDSMHEGLTCHVLAQLDASGDMFPFTRAGIPSAILWRWRFVGRHPETVYGHSSADTPDKLRLRELKEYAGYLARLLLRLSHVPPEDWPENRLDPQEIQQRLTSERGTVFRTM
ncbi:MAG: M28 family peptidase [Planctomycetaceae bacterium]|nr:M28 family peptidase [Planctomycetaceae bacterium]